MERASGVFCVSKCLLKRLLLLVQRLDGKLEKFHGTFMGIFWKNDDTSECATVFKILKCKNQVIMFLIFFGDLAQR